MRAKGIDISHWQDSFTYNGQIDFVIQKATEGWSWTDPKFEEFLPEVQKVPIRGAYHYFMTALDPLSQARHFYETTKDKGFHFLAVDYEQYSNTLDRTGEAKLSRFWENLKKLTDLPLVLYTSPYILRDRLMAFNPVWGERKLWIAHWNGQDPESGSPTVFDASGWLLWQYTNDPIDKNVYNGTVEQMLEWLDPQPEESDPVEPKKWYESKTLWFFILTLIVSVAGLFGFADFELSPGQAEIIGVIISIIGVLLRAFTKQGVKF